MAITGNTWLEIKQYLNFIDFLFQLLRIALKRGGFLVWASDREIGRPNFYALHQIFCKPLCYDPAKVEVVNKE